VQELTASLQLAFDSGAKRVLLPISSAMDIPTVPAELFTKFQVSFYSESVDAVYKALDVN
jgi:predicted ATP-dependent Lon-type protease